MSSNQIVIEIFSSDFQTRTIRAKEQGGRDFSFREQRAYLHKPGDPYPSPCQISLGDRPAFAPGRYTLAPASFSVGRFGSPELVRELVLVPVPAVSQSGSESARPAAARSA